MWSNTESGAEFDRIMKLLARWDRKPRRVERGFKEGGRKQRMTFEKAIVLLDKGRPKIVTVTIFRERAARTWARRPDK